MRIFTQLRDAMRLDPTELNPNASHEPLRSNYELAIQRRRSRNVGSNSVLARLIVFFCRFFRCLPYLCNRGPACESGAVYFCALSGNQLAALRPVARELVELGQRVYLIDDFDQAKKEHLPLRLRAYLLARPFLPMLLWRMARSRGYKRESFKRAFGSYWNSYGLYLVYRRWLARHRPAAVVVSTDHLQIPCTLVKAARDEHIPTFYIQHASVTERFPPLRIDYALLDGRDAMEKYLGAGPTRARIYLIGSPKKSTDASQVNQSVVTRSVGLCLSQADRLDRFKLLLGELGCWTGRLQLIVRPHPGMGPETIDPLREKAEELGMTWSDSRQEPADAFLSKIDAVICGASSIALEAAIRNVLPISLEMNETTPDWYGFVDRGLCRQTDDIETLNRWLEELYCERPSVRSMTHYYDHSIEKPYEGRSAKLAADLILQLSVNRQSVPDGYTRISDIAGVRAFEPVDDILSRIRPKDSSELQVVAS